MRPLLLASALALAAGSAAAQDAAAINLRDYWILAEIENPATGQRAEIRVDCSDQSPLLCEGGDKPRSLGGALEAACRASRRTGPGAPTSLHLAPPWPAFLRAEIVPFFPGIVGYIVSGAGGFAVGNERWLDGALLPKAAPFSELREERGFRSRIATMNGCERVERSDVRLTLWLLTPEELKRQDKR